MRVKPSKPTKSSEVAAQVVNDTLARMEKYYSDGDIFLDFIVHGKVDLLRLSRALYGEDTPSQLELPKGRR